MKRQLSEPEFIELKNFPNSKSSTNFKKFEFRQFRPSLAIDDGFIIFKQLLSKFLQFITPGKTNK